MRFLVECTYVFEHPDDNSGIQRVVRNIINHLDGSTAIPVMFNNGELFKVKRLKPAKQSDLLDRSVLYWKNKHAGLWRLNAHLNTKKPLSLSHKFRLVSHACFLFISLWFKLVIFLLDRLNQYAQIRKSQIEPIDPRKGDVLLLLDSSWHSDFFKDVEALKKKGIPVISVIYDLIPLTHPQFCDENLVKVFQQWFDWISHTADGFMCISKATASDVTHFNSIQNAELKSSQWIDHFYLGYELDLASDNSLIHASLEEAFSPPRPTYLMVSTIEPRKNHAYLLDAFEKLWANGHDLALCIVGKIGWKVDDLIERIEQHPEYGQRLFMFNKLNDSELQICYQNARALIFPSFTEGFGLPLIEALSKNLPVLASDIPVFQEIGGGFVEHFNLSNPDDLMDKVLEFEKLTDKEISEKVNDWQWINWEQSARQLLDKTRSHLEND